MLCKLILPSNEIHKLRTVPKTYDDLHQMALQKFKGKIPDQVSFKYIDSDDELINLANDDDFETAVVTSEADKVKTLRIFLIPESAVVNVNPNAYLPNIQPASQESSSTEDFLNKGMRFKQSGKEPIAQGYSKKSERKDLGYEKLDPYDGLNRQSGKEVLGREPFNQDQMNVISDIFEKKLKERVEQGVNVAVNEIMGKINDERKSKPVKKNPYTHNPLMSKSFVSSSSFAAKPLIKSEKNQNDTKEHFCTTCRKKIDDATNPMGHINMNEKSMIDNQNPYQTKSSAFWNKGVGMSSSSTIGKNKGTPKPYETPGGEVKRYKAAIVKPPIYDLINVKAGHKYRVEFTIKNAGTEAWPENIKLVCINGIHKEIEEPLPALASLEKFEVKLDLKAPQEPSRYLSQWRLQYYDEDTPKLFGSNLFIEINVVEDINSKPISSKHVEEQKKAEKAVSDKDASNKVDNVVSPSSGMKERVKPAAPEIEKPVIEIHSSEERVKPQDEKLKGSGLDIADKDEFTAEERKLMKEKKCSETVLRHAQALHAIYPDSDLEDQIDFVADCPIHLEINDIVMSYATRMDSGF